MEPTNKLLEQALEVMEQHGLDELFVNESGHFFTRENPAVCSVGGDKKKVQKLSRKELESQRKLADQVVAALVASVEQATNLPSREISEGTEEAGAAGATTGVNVFLKESLVTDVVPVVYTEEAKADNPVQTEAEAVVEKIDEPVQAGLFDNPEKKLAVQAIAGNPDSPEERGELVEKPAAPKAGKSSKTSKAKGA